MKNIDEQIGEIIDRAVNYAEFVHGKDAITIKQAVKEFGKIDKDVLRITGESIGSEPLTLDKPEEM